MPELAPLTPTGDPPFAIEDVDVDRDRHVIELAGQVDLYTAPEFKERMAQAIERKKTRIAVDVTGVTFMDSTALGVLVGALKRVRPLNGAIVVVVTDERIRNLFELTGLDATFPLCDTREAALERLA
jgi:anti-sigma B factor antagonist